MIPLSGHERDILQSAFFDGVLLVQDGVVLAEKTNVAFRGTDYVRAFRSLRVRDFLDWKGHRPEGGELYGISETGKAAFEEDSAARTQAGRQPAG
jgi:hypothetical protein